MAKTTKLERISNVLEENWLATRPGERCIIRVSAAETGGAYSIVEIISQPGDSTPMHVHSNEDEHFVILEGTARVARGGDIFDAEAGTVLSLPRGIPHPWGNPTDKLLRLVATTTPGGVEEALEVIARGNVEELVALADRFKVQVAGPPLL